MTATPPSTTCPTCGAPADGRFCSQCGSSLASRTCADCGAALSHQARFCHRCGRPVGESPGAGAARARPAASERTAWLVAAALCIVLVAAIVWRVLRDQPAPAVPDMANAGVQAAAGPDAGGAPAGPAPDISRMSPRERFDRLFNRIMQAAERGDSAQVLRFTPMALGAYAQLDTVDADARYHAAVLRLQAGDAAGARALADTILDQTPGHLLGYVIRGTAADLAGDTDAGNAARRSFLQHFTAESASARPEYRDHAPVLDEFRAGARALGR